MISKDNIKAMLTTVATNNGLTGQSVNMLIDQLTYSLYHQQLEVINAVQESNLSTASLMNSKIRNCMNVMYPVYRGKNARVKLNLINDTVINYGKFDLVYTSNTFKVYADASPEGGAWNLPKSDRTAENQDPKTFIGILSKSEICESSVVITNTSKYYVDFIIDYEVIGDLSEDIQVFIDGYEYPTTRNFYDFIQQPHSGVTSNIAYRVNDTLYYIDDITDTEWKSLNLLNLSKDEVVKMGTFTIIRDVSSDTELPLLPGSKFEKLFVLTIPDYGIRVFKRGYFSTSSEVKIRAFKYTTMDDINYDEFQKIKLPGTELILPEGEEYLSKDHIVNRFNQVGKDGEFTYRDSGIISEVERDHAKSILFNANLYERLQGKILSNSDLNALFTETYRDVVMNATNYYVETSGTVGADLGSRRFTDGNVIIFYTPNTDGDIVSESSFRSDFIPSYGSYFISKNLEQMSGELINIVVDLALVVSDTSDLTDDVTRIFNQYANKLNDPTTFDMANPTNESSNVLKQRKIRAEISKLASVDYIESLQFTEYTPLTPIEEGFETIHDNIGDIGFSPVEWEDVLKGTGLNWKWNPGNQGIDDGLKTVQSLPVAFIPRRVKLHDSDGKLRSEYTLVPVPTYYKFKINIIYHYSYENISG